MKTAFILTDTHHLASALVADDFLAAVSVGTRISVTRELLMAPHATIAQGELGTIDYIDVCTGFIEILLDKYHHGLCSWLNHICLDPFGSEDIIDGIICSAAS